MEIVDAQIHLWSGDAAPPHHWRRPFLINDALRAMDEAGIDRAVNCPAVWDSHSNDYAVEAARLHPDRFATLGWFPLDGQLDAAMVDQWMERPGMRGLRFLLAAPESWQKFVDGALDDVFDAAGKRGLPLGLMLPPTELGRIAAIAERNPGLKILVDHLGISPFAKLPDAAANVADLVTLATHANIAVKATAAPSMSNEDYPFADTFDTLKTIYDAFGADRFFWGSDFTRMHCSWRECATMFLENLPWLSGDTQELVMGRAVRNWIGWK